MHKPSETCLEAVSLTNFSIVDGIDIVQGLLTDYRDLLVVKWLKREIEVVDIRKTRKKSERESFDLLLLIRI